MRHRLAFLISFCALTSFLSEGANISGVEYVRLNEWAQSAGYKAKWLQRDKVVQFTGARMSATFEVDSRKADIGGVTVLLSFPIAASHGAAMISQLDLRSTVEPIISPHPKRKPIKTICLDPGHGGHDTGKIDGRNLEKNYTLLIANEVAALLRKNGFKVVMTRTRDKTLDLTERPETARRAGADLFVSLHYNAGPSEVHGVEVYCLTPAGANSSNAGGGKSTSSRSLGNANDDNNVLLAYALQKTIVRETGLEDRAMKRARFEVLREAPMPAVLIEGGFMSNRADAKKIYDSAFRKRMAQAIVDGIQGYKQLAGR
ncbi:MAG: N-acetylmuramoyl-L-alanine amidase family protein [Limisphaerales bacterium]